MQEKKTDYWQNEKYELTISNAKRIFGVIK